MANVVVTGAGSGYGRALAQYYLDQGDFVYLIGRTTNNLIETSLGYDNCEIITCDLTCDKQVAEMFLTYDITDVDLLINAAGIKPLDDWDEVMNINAKAQWTFTLDMIPRMNTKRILFFTSQRTHTYDKGTEIYSISKFAVEGMTFNLANMCPDGFINVISPGPAKSKVNRKSLIDPESKVQEIVKFIHSDSNGERYELPNI